MDNLCHTLLGAALAQSGLKKRSPLGTTILLKGPAWNQIRFTVAGKNPKSTGFYVGIDLMKYTPFVVAPGLTVPKSGLLDLIKKLP